MERTMDFTRGPIVGPLLKFSMPILFALFLQALYGAVDLMVVGKFALAQDVSGVAIGSQIMHTVTGLISSLAMGTTILLGQKLGEGNAKSCGKIIGTSIVLFFGTAYYFDPAVFGTAGCAYECAFGGLRADEQVYCDLWGRLFDDCRL